MFFYYTEANKVLRHRLFKTTLITHHMQISAEVESIKSSEETGSVRSDEITSFLDSIRSQKSSSTNELSLLSPSNFSVLNDRLEKLRFLNNSSSFETPSPPLAGESQNSKPLVVVVVNKSAAPGSSVVGDVAKVESKKSADIEKCLMNMNSMDKFARQYSEENRLESEHFIVNDLDLNLDSRQMLCLSGDKDRSTRLMVVGDEKEENYESDDSYAAGFTSCIKSVAIFASRSKIVNAEANLNGGLFRIIVLKNRKSKQVYAFMIRISGNLSYSNAANHGNRRSSKSSVRSNEVWLWWT